MEEENALGHPFRVSRIVSLPRSTNPGVGRVAGPLVPPTPHSRRAAEQGFAAEARAVKRRETRPRRLMAGGVYTHVIGEDSCQEMIWLRRNRVDRETGLVDTSRTVVGEVLSAPRR